MSILNKALSRISIHFLQIAKYSVNIPDSSGAFIFKSNFTTEEQERILDTLNGSNLDQLASFSVSQSRIKNLKTWKTKRGPFRSLNDVLEVDGLGEKVLGRICEQIINDGGSLSSKDFVKKSKKTSKRVKQLISPPLSSNTAYKIQSAVGIHLGPMGISWAKLSNDQNELCSWNYQGFSVLPKKMLPVDTFELAVQTIPKLPVGDIYILESNQSMSPQATIQTSAIASYNQQLELTSMLIALLNTSVQHNQSLSSQKPECNGSTWKSIENKVHHLRAKLPARLFRTLVGRERVSAFETVMELLENDGKSKPFTLPCTPIFVKEHLRSAFLSQSPANKELLGQALVLVVSFMDLCVHKNPISLVAIAPGNNSNNNNKN